MDDTIDLSAHDLLRTTRAVRKRLDLTRPVPREIISDCIADAIQAPTGSNAQGWQWIVVTDPAKKTALAELYARHFDPYIEMATPWKDGDLRAEQAGRVSASARYLRDHFHEVPAMVIPCAMGRLRGEFDNFAASSFYGSVLPAAWNFMLALRLRGLGSAWTTLHLPSEREAADLLGIPFDDVTQMGLFPVAYTLGTDFKPATRLDASELTHWDTW